jgi:aminoacyl-tRNA hydrolase
VVTCIGTDHFTAFKSRDAIAHEKGKLIRSLPANGIAILNADDPRVLAMQADCFGRTITYGLAPDAMLRGNAIDARWPMRLGLEVHWQGETVYVQTQLCGAHWAPVVLAAVATGVALGVPLPVVVRALASVPPFEGRMAPVWQDGVTFIRDDWKAPFSSIGPAFEFMRDARAGRKIIVVGTISDYQGDSTRRYVDVAKMALEVADCVVFVGPRASACMRAKQGSDKELLAFASLRDASALLNSYFKPGDLVLLKGSHKADHMQRLLIALTDTVQCWRVDCGRMQSCETCELLHVASGPALAKEVAFPLAVPLSVDSVGSEFGASTHITQVVVGLGNPAKDLANTPHNVGFRTVEVLAQRMAVPWVEDSQLTLVARGEYQGLVLCLIKLRVPMNEIGPVLLKLSHDLAFTVAQCVLVQDDLDLPLGVVRARLRGGDGGHLGVRSIIQSFQDDKFRRVKMGVAPVQSSGSVADYVLTPFVSDQMGIVVSASEVAADRVLEILRQPTR